MRVVLLIMSSDGVYYTHTIALVVSLQGSITLVENLVVSYKET